MFYSMVYGGVNTVDPNRPAGLRSAHGSTDMTMVIYDPVINSTNRDFQLATLVHEQAHAMDVASDRRLSNRMMAATGSRYENGTYVPQGSLSSSYSRHNSGEDFAETVAAAVYPGYSEYYNASTGKSHMGTSRANYIRGILPNTTVDPSTDVH